MFVLINRDSYDLIAKHPNCVVLYNLGIINCPESQETIPFENGMFKDWDDHEVTMLFIGITLESPDPSWSREQVEYLLMYYINECKENILDQKEVCDQAQYAIEWDIQGYCSFLKGKREPSFDEGLWDNLNVDYDPEIAATLLATMNPIVFKPAIQRPFE